MTPELAAALLGSPTTKAGMARDLAEVLGTIDRQGTAMLQELPGGISLADQDMLLRTLRVIQGGMLHLAQQLEVQPVVPLPTGVVRLPVRLRAVSGGAGEG